jgi:probable phosphoglycerate mutase
LDLLLIRHAEPERIENADGPADPQLTPLGLEQAARLAEWLGAEDIHAIYASPLRRSRQTAAALEATLGHAAVVDAGLAEFDAEASSYIPMDEIRRQPDALSALVEGRWEELGTMAEPEAFRAGAIATVENVVSTNGGKTVAVVCHGAVINVYLGHIIGTPRLLWFEPSYASISRVVASRTGIRTVVSVNEVAHLR